MKKIIEKPVRGRMVDKCFPLFMERLEALSNIKGGNTCHILKTCCSNVAGKVVCAGGYGANCYNYLCNKKFKTVAIVEPQMYG